MQEDTKWLIYVDFMKVNIMSEFLEIAVAIQIIIVNYCSFVLLGVNVDFMKRYFGNLIIIPAFLIMAYMLLLNTLEVKINSHSKRMQIVLCISLMVLTLFNVDLVAKIKLTSLTIIGWISVFALSVLYAYNNKIFLALKKLIITLRETGETRGGK